MTAGKFKRALTGRVPVVALLRSTPPTAVSPAWTGPYVEELVAVMIFRWGCSLAGLVVAICAYLRASKRVDVPNKVLAQVAALEAKMKSVETCFEHKLGAFEDRYISWTKRQAASQAGPRGPNKPPEPEAPPDSGPVQVLRGPDGNTQGVLGDLPPDQAREAIQAARITGGG